MNPIDQGITTNGRGKYRAQYLENLKKEASNIALNMNANAILAKTGETPSVLEDARTNSEKMLDLEGVKSEIRAWLLSTKICTGSDANNFVQRASESMLQFCLTHKDFILNNFKPRDVSYLIFFNYVGKLEKIEEQTSGLNYPMQEETGRDLLEGIYSLNDPMSQSSDGTSPVPIHGYEYAEPEPIDYSPNLKPPAYEPKTDFEPPIINFTPENWGLEDIDLQDHKDFIRQLMRSGEITSIKSLGHTKMKTLTRAFIDWWHSAPELVQANAGDGNKKMDGKGIKVKKVRMRGKGLNLKKMDEAYEPKAKPYIQLGTLILDQEKLKNNILYVKKLSGESALKKFPAKNLLYFKIQRWPFVKNWFYFYFSKTDCI
jgi:hypothetical protein